MKKKKLNGGPEILPAESSIAAIELGHERHLKLQIEMRKYTSI